MYLLIFSKRKPRFTTVVDNRETLHHQMSCVNKQLIINRFRVPDELSDIIKEFCFVDVAEKTKRLFSAVLQELNQLEIKYFRDRTKTRVSRTMRDKYRRIMEICDSCGKFLDESKCRSYSHKIQCGCCHERCAAYVIVNGYERKIKLISHAGYFFRQRSLSSKPYSKTLRRREEDLALFALLDKKSC